jgi:hypothetical protein
MVFWQVISWQGVKTQRAGEVIAIVPAEIHPNNIGMGRVVSDSAPARNDVSYLIKTPDSNVLFWVSKCWALTPENEHILTEQRKVTIKATDRTDRLKIKKQLRLMGADFTESEDMINTEGGRRIWFATTDGVEYLKRVENIKLGVVVC